MMDINGHLTELADRLDREYKTSCADAVDNLIKTSSLEKVAQYVGVIGYVLKQNRAMCNCIRRKRASQDGSMQDIIMQCLKEYQDGQSYNDTDWHKKYAQVITHEPEKFDSAHLYLLAEMGSHNSIAEHLDNVRKTATILQNNDVEDEVIGKILAQADTLGEILSKEADFSVPFKVAATPSKRGWWSRFWNPSEETWWNPRSWSQNVRSRGEDEETIAYMDSLAREITNSSRIAQNIRTDIDRIKSIQPHLTSVPKSHKDAKHVNLLLTTIQQLNENDWQQNIKVLRSLKNTLQNAELQDPHNQEYINLAFKLSDDIDNGVQDIYQSIQVAKNQIDILSGQAPIRGREHGGFGYGERMTVELNNLEDVLNIINRNPLNLKSYAMSKRMLARINDLLRISSPGEISSDQDIYDEISNLEDAPPEPQKPQIPTNEITSGEPISKFVDVDQKVQDIMNGIKNEGIDAEKARQVLVQLISSGLPETNSLDVLKLVAEALKSESLKSRSNPDLVSTPVSKTSPKQNNKSKNKTNEPVEFKTPGSGSGVSTGQNIDLGSGTFVGSSFDANTIIKLADVVDEVDPDIAILIDEFLKNNKVDTASLQQMPEFSVLIRENLKE